MRKEKAGRDIALVLFIVLTVSPIFACEDCDMAVQLVNKTVDMFEAQG
jgi:hypothetical protein